MSDRTKEKKTDASSSIPPHWNNMWCGTCKRDLQRYTPDKNQMTKKTEDKADTLNKKTNK